MTDESDNQEIPLRFRRQAVRKITTGSETFDNLLGGGLPVSGITDIFGAAGTGKTQFAFQNAIMNSFDSSKEGNQKVVFVDCMGSFRPERIVEIADARSMKPSAILENIYAIYVRSVDEQNRATLSIESDALFSRVRLVIVDDVTSNFVNDYPKEDLIAERQRLLLLYARRLAYLALSRGFSVLFTNSIRSRGELGEVETSGDVLSALSLCRLHFSKKDRDRFAFVVQPDLTNPRIRFEIEAAGIS